MTTAISIINRAYSLLGYKEAGETLGYDDTQYALDALNSLIDSWNTQNLFIVTTQEVVANVSTVSATIGTGLNFNTTRPVAINNGAFSRLAGVDYPMEQIDLQQYESIVLKSVTASFPQYFYYDANTTNAKVYFYPVPSTSLEIHLPVQSQLTAFADLVTNYTLAQGYQRALEYCLAEELSAGVRSLNPLIMRQAMLARRAIRRTNVRVPQLNSGVQNVRFNIYSGL